MKRPQIRKQTKRVVLTATASFVIFQLGFSFLLPWWHPDTEYRVRKEALQARSAERPNDLVLAMVGSSRVSYAFVPEQLSSLTDNQQRSVLAFNFGHAASGPVSNLLQVKRLLRAELKPRWLIVEVNPSLCHNEWKTVFDLSSWEDVSTVSQYYPFKYFRTAFVRNHFLMPWFRHRWELQERYLQDKEPGRGTMQISPHGWQLTVGEEIGTEERLRLTEVQHQVLAPALAADFRIAPCSNQAYRDLLTLCRAESIEVALILMPEGETARSWANPAVDEAMRAFLGDLSTEFSVPVFNAREWFDDSCFSDSSHLLRPGARQFTRRLEQECIQPWLRGQVPRFVAAR